MKVKNVTVNQKAFDLRSKLFALVGELRDLQLATKAIPDFDARFEAHQQADAAASGLAKVHESLGDLFFDAARDTENQAFASEAA